MTSSDPQKWNFGVTRLVVGIIFYIITEPVFHESGHIFTILMLGGVVKSAVYFGASPMVHYVMFPTFFQNFLVSISGFCTLPIYLLFYKGFFGKFIPYELAAIILICVCSFLGGDLLILLHSYGYITYTPI
jgi:hypothetical protein